MSSSSSPLRIAYVTKGSARDLGNWSGIVCHMREALENLGHTIYDVDNIPVVVPIISRIWGRGVRMATRKAYLYDRDPWVIRQSARKVENKIAALSVDCVVAPLIDSAFGLNAKPPIACWADATFHSYVSEYHTRFAGVSPCSMRRGHDLERATFGRASLLAFASRWAANDAIVYYGVDPEKVAVVPFGANCQSPFASEDEALACIASRPNAPFRLLFVGLEWERKGGPLTLDIHQELRRRNIDARLTIVGCNPFPNSVPEGVVCFGRLNKADPVQAAQLEACFRESHIFIMPTRAECFGVVYAEAAAHALPSIGTRTGGVPDAVAEGVSGFLFDSGDGSSPYCDILEKLATDSEFLSRISLGAYHHHLQRLNWTVAATRFSKLVSSRLKPRAAN